MDLSRLATELEARKSGVRKAIWPLLVNARSACVAAQARPDADDELGRIEELANADAEPIFLREEMALERLSNEINDAVGAMEDPPEAAYELQANAGDAGGQAREWFARKLASIVAQARAAELLTVAPGAPAKARSDTCARCGAPLSPQAMQTRRCAQCQAPV